MTAVDIERLVRVLTVKGRRRIADSKKFSGLGRKSLSRLILFGYVLRVSAGQAIETRFLFQKNEKTTSFWNRNAIITAGDTNEAY